MFVGVQQRLDGGIGGPDGAGAASLINGERNPLELSPDESLLVSRWATKTGLVLSSVTMDGSTRDLTGLRESCEAPGRFPDTWGIFAASNRRKIATSFPPACPYRPRWRGDVIRWRHSRFMPRRWLSPLFLLPLKWLVKDCRFEGHIAPGGILSADGTLPLALEHHVRCPHGHRRCATRRNAVPRRVRRSRNLVAGPDTGR